MATLRTYYEVEASNYHNANFSIQLSEIDDINTNCTEKELASQVRAVWRKRRVSELGELTITPMRKFEVQDGEDSNKKYTLEISKKQTRSKKEDITLWVGGIYNAKQVIEWQQPFEETA